MDKIIGLDIGTNSIGSSMIEWDASCFKGKILYLGTRHIPAGGEQYNYFLQGKPLTNSKGQTVSECAQRRRFRSQRKNISRYRQRRDNLILVLDILGINPTGLQYTIDKSGIYPKVSVLPVERKEKTKIHRTAYDIRNTELYKVYELRNRAINGKLTLNELGRVLYSLNTRRGYQDIGLVDCEELEENIKKLKPNQRITRLTITNAIFTQKFRKKKPEFDFTAIENDLDQIVGKTYIPYFDKYIGKNLEFLLETDKEGTVELKLFKKTEWGKSREENNTSLKGKTIGEKLYEEIEERIISGEPHWKNFKLRNRVYDRKHYKEEFNKVWERQSLLHERLLNTPLEILETIAKVLVPKNEMKQNFLIQKGLKYILKEYIIFYQRPLKKGQKDLIAKCAFEKDEERIDEQGKSFKVIYKGIAKSHPLFQEFRIWQTINNIIIKNNAGDTIYLDNNHYKILYELLNSKELIAPSEILKALGFSKESCFINYREEAKIPGNKTLTAVRKCFPKNERDHLSEITVDPFKYTHFWHILYSIPASNKAAKIQALTSSKFRLDSRVGALTYFTFNVSENTAKKLAELKLESNYAGLSRRSILKLLPLMKRGEYFKIAEVNSVIKEKLTTIFRDGDVSGISEKLLTKIREFKAIEDFQGLLYSEAAELVYGMHTKQKIVAEYDSPNDIKFIDQHSLRHPIVEKIINETLKTVKAIWEDPKLGKPTHIAVELARELQNSQKQRESIYKSQNSNKETNEKAKTALQSDKFNIPNPTLRQIERYKLWQEQQYQCPYTGNYISPEDFTAYEKGDFKYDVDHIIPRTRLKDDSISNKVLCLRDANQAKGNLLARTFMEKERIYKNLREFHDYTEWVKKLPLIKRTKLLMTEEDLPDDFIERQLKETQYITKRVIEELSKIVGSDKIIFTSGGITNILRHEWGIDDIFKRELKDRYQQWEEKLKSKGVQKELIKEENSKLTINEFSKRVDLRNHALDALVVACTTPKHIKYLNHLNKIFQDRENQENITLKNFVTETINDNDKRKLRFKKPWDSFCQNVIDATKQILISIKNERVYTNEAGAVKGMLHDQNPIGWRHIANPPIPVAQFISILKRLKSKDEVLKYINEHLPHSLREKIKERLIRCNFDTKILEKELHQQPLLNINEEPIHDITTYNRKLVSRIRLSNLSEKDIKENLVVDKEILRNLKEHMNKYKNFKEAFLPENLELFNTEREENGKFPVYKILTRGRENFNIEDLSSNNRIIKRKNSYNDRAVFALKDKAYSIIYEGVDASGQRIRLHKPLPLFDYIQAVKSGNDFVEKIEGYNKYLLFDSYQYMYVPEPNEVITEDTFKNKKQLFNNLYYLKRLSKNDWYFLPHYVSKPLIEKVRINENSEIIIKEFAESTEDFVKDLNYGLTIKEYGIPVKVSRIGNVTPMKWCAI